MNIKEQFTQVTPLSKFLALILFILLPIGGFLVGVECGKNSIVVIPGGGQVSDKYNESSNISNYKNDTYGFSFQYPSDMVVEEVLDESSTLFKLKVTIPENMIPEGVMGAEFRNQVPEVYVTVYEDAVLYQTRIESLSEEYESSWNLYQLDNDLSDLMKSYRYNSGLVGLVYIAHTELREGYGVYEVETIDAHTSIAHLIAQSFVLGGDISL